VPDGTYELIKGEFVLRERGEIEAREGSDAHIARVFDKFFGSA
jgi:hypothetical protein